MAHMRLAGKTQKKSQIFGIAPSWFLTATRNLQIAIQVALFLGRFISLNATGAMALEKLWRIEK